MIDRTIYNLAGERGIVSSKKALISRILTSYYYIDIYRPINEEYIPIENEENINLLFIYMLKESLKIIFSKDWIIEDQKEILKEFEKKDIINEDSDLNVLELWEKNFKKFSKLKNYEQSDLMKVIWNYKEGKNLNFKLIEYLDFIMDEKNKEIKNYLWEKFANEIKIIRKEEFDHYINELKKRLKNNDNKNAIEDKNVFDFYLFNENVKKKYEEFKNANSFIFDWYFKENTTEYKIKQNCLKLLIYFTNIYNKLSFKYQKENKYLINNVDRHFISDFHNKVFNTILSECKDIVFYFYKNNDKKNYKNEKKNNEGRKNETNIKRPYDGGYKKKCLISYISNYNYFEKFRKESSWQSKEYKNDGENIEREICHGKNIKITKGNQALKLFKKIMQYGLSYENGKIMAEKTRIIDYLKIIKDDRENNNRLSDYFKLVLETDETKIKKKDDNYIKKCSNEYKNFEEFKKRKIKQLFEKIVENGDKINKMEMKKNKMDVEEKINKKKQINNEVNNSYINHINYCNILNESSEIFYDSSIASGNQLFI